MTAREEAQDFLDQYREAHGIAPSAPLPEAVANNKGLIDQLLRTSFSPEAAQDPEFRQHLERTFDLAVRGGFDAMLSAVLGGLQDDINQTMAGRVKWGKTGAEVDFGQRTLIGHLQTGQLNAMSMAVPGSDAYLVIFEDQMPRFASLLCRTVAQVFPRDRSADGSGGLGFAISLADVTQRIETDPTIINRFVDIVVSYAVTGKLDQAHRGRQSLSPDYETYAAQLETSLLYFVIGHEYGHIISGHLDAAPKGFLPTDELTEMAYSWNQEHEADFWGMILATNTCEDRRKVHFGSTFLGISLYFDAQDVMDRAVALLQTGDENARQLGSHPPANLRKRRLRDQLAKLIEDDPTGGFSRRVGLGLEVEAVQTKIMSLLWERTRPILVSLHEQGVPAAHTWRTIPKATQHEPTGRALLPTGHHVGVHQVRLGTKVHTLTPEQSAVWNQAHGPLQAIYDPDPYNKIHWHRQTIERQAHDADAGRSIDELLAMGLLVEVESGTEQALDFARSHRLVPLMLGLGESADKHGVFGVGFLGKRVLKLSYAEYELWRWSAMENSLWESCQNAADAARRAGYTDPAWTDPTEQLAVLLDILPAMLLANAACLDNCDRFTGAPPGATGYRSPAAERLIIPFGQYFGRRTNADVHDIRIGWDTYELTGSAQLAVWRLAHGRPDNLEPWTLADLERAARAEGIPDASSVLADLIGRELLLEVVPGTQEAVELTQMCCTRSMLIGFGNTAEEPTRYRIAHPMNEVEIRVPHFTHELWKWGHLCDNLWDACHVLSDRPDQTLTECWRAIQTLLAGGAIYLDVGPDDF